MRAHSVVSCLIGANLLVGLAAAQTQEPAPKKLASEIGFSYSLPQGWTVVEAKPSSEVVNTQPPQAPATEEQKKGTACIQVALTAQHGSPASVIVIAGFPFDCYGQTMTEQDLAGFGSGATEGLKQIFNLLDPIYGVYSLGSHHLWIERAKGVRKDHPEAQYTVEIACAMLQKGAVCWMTTAADGASLKAFEEAPVTLEGEAPTPLVPATAFDKAPAPS